MPNCEIISGGVNNAEKTKIPKKKYFLFLLKNLISTIPNFVKIIKRIGNSNDIPDANNKNIVNFIYSEYLDSSSKLKPEEKKFSNEIKKVQIKGIKIKYAKAIPKKNKIGIKKNTGIKIFFFNSWTNILISSTFFFSFKKDLDNEFFSSNNFCF